MVKIILEIRENPRHPCYPCAKNSLAKRGIGSNAVAIWQISEAVY